MVQLSYSMYIEETGESCVTLSTELGDFYGSAKLSPEDKEIASSFFGCEVAEMRAFIKYFKAKAKLIKRDIKTLKDFENVLTGMAGFDYKAKEYRQLRKQIHIKEGKYNKYLGYIDSLEKTIENKFNARMEIINRIKKGRTN